MKKQLVFQETEPYEKGFESYLNEKIAPLFEGLNKRRKEVSKAIKKDILLFIALSIPYYGSYGFFQVWRYIPEDRILMLILILPVIILMVTISNRKRKYEVHYKEQVAEKVLSFLAPFNYREDGSIDEKYLNQTQLFKNHDRKTVGDYFTGKYKDLEVAFQELETTKKSGKSTVTVFKGILVLYEHPRKFNAHTIVRRDRGLLERFSKPSGLESTRLEDPKFEKLFEVYTEDPIEARYLLPPDVMEHVKHISDHFGGAPVELSFLEGKVLIKVRIGKDFFPSPSISTISHDTWFLKESLRDCYLLLEMIDKLKMTPKKYGYLPPKS